MRDESHYTERNIGLDEKTVYQERIIRQQMISEPLRHRVPDRSIKEIITPYQEAYEMKIKLGVKLYLFIIITVLAVAIGTAALAYNINANQIDRYYKQVAFDSAVNFSSFVDGDYLRKLRTAVETDEFQSLRETAEENDDEAAIQNYLEKNGLWEGYTETRGKLVRYCVHPEDRAMFQEAFSKARIKQALDQSGAFTLKYRLLEDGSPVDVRMKAKRMRPGSNQIIVSISLL